MGAPHSGVAQTLPPPPEQSGTEPPGPWVPSLADISGDVVEIAAAPLQLRHKEHLMTLGASALVLGVSTVFDQPAYDHWALREGPSTASTPRHLGVLGDLYDTVGPRNVALASIGGFAIGGLALRDRKMTRTSVRLVEAVVFTKLVTGVTKGALSRPRPYVGDGPFAVDPLNFDADTEYLSLPSGHTSRAFAIASVIAHQYPTRWVEAGAYSVAASVGVQRVASGKHWLSDVVLGAAIGYAIGRTVSDTPRLTPSEGSLRITPLISPLRTGVAVQF